MRKLHGTPAFTDRMEPLLLKNLELCPSLRVNAPTLSADRQRAASSSRCSGRNSVRCECPLGSTACGGSSSRRCSGFQRAVAPLRCGRVRYGTRCAKQSSRHCPLWRRSTACNGGWRRVWAWPQDAAPSPVDGIGLPVSAGRTPPSAAAAGRRNPGCCGRGDGGGRVRSAGSGWRCPST